VELAAAAAVLRDRINTAHMLAGVTIVDPSTTWIEPAATFEADTIVHPFTVIRGATRVAEGAEIGPSRGCHRRRDRTCRDHRALLLRSPRYGSRCAIEGRHVR
jgi:bifunctional N-acetylglucosamine-1-phosphate-uridyltransferase/glucosamine-1-phosphate-acetyltransferase GlmU-like protein